ncbi:MAG: hypothetical protein PUG12_01580 [Prevotella sp.]|nr:hypothetical protein [Prevotella sp.]
MPFSLQLLLENVVKHNAITSELPMTVKIVFLSCPRATYALLAVSIPEVVRCLSIAMKWNN